MDGWVRTGDEVVIKNQEVFVVDRLKVSSFPFLMYLDLISCQEIMKVRGYQVAPAELEGFLLLRPDVVDACVVSILDDYSGEIPLAFIVLDLDTQKRVRGDEAALNGLKKAIQKVFLSNNDSCQSDVLIFL